MKCHAQYTGQMIQQLRKQKNMTQKELADLVHVTNKAVSKWERGINYPDIASLETIAMALDSTVVQILGLDNVSKEDVVIEMARISKEEESRIHSEMFGRGIFSVVLGIIILILIAVEQYILKGMEPEPAIDSVWSMITGIRGAVALIIANGLWTAVKCKRLMK